MPEMVEVVVDSIRVSLMNQQRIVILREMDAERYLAIWVGVYEAEHLTIALEKVEVSRPLTYNLFVKMVEALNAQVVRVEVVALRDETFYGNVILELEGELIEIDARPSDAMNLAVRAEAPIYVASEVMDAASIIPEDDEISIDEDQFDEDDIPTEKRGQDLSVFEDFFNQIDMDEPSDDHTDDTED
ncbi:MAG: bifunctional nuclease family protein [Anaerolineae bacterium]|nr:bifunctional nuclease family protein [Anaerolineae bacterium]